MTILKQSFLAGAAAVALLSAAPLGPAFSATLAWPPEPSAHIAGLLAGAAVAAAGLWRYACRSWYFPWASCSLING